MKYLTKSSLSLILQHNWHYSVSSQRRQIRAQLVSEQWGYCAYTEKYISPIEACEIEHFDDRLKEHATDSYWNWYAVIRWANQRKRRIENFLPILTPYDPSVTSRIRYQNDEFLPLNESDVEAKNLIEFLGWNSPELAEYRSKFIARKKQDCADFFAGDVAAYFEYLKQDPENLSFRTALEAEFSLSLEMQAK